MMYFRFAPFFEHVSANCATSQVCGGGAICTRPMDASQPFQVT
jgi:hypothetical protein